MVINLLKYDIVPGKTDEFIEWAKGAIPQLLSVPGLVELRSYRPAVGDSQIATTYEFADMTAWAKFQENETVQRLTMEIRTYTVNFRTELWGPSPVVPDPIRPGS